MSAIKIIATLFLLRLLEISPSLRMASSASWYSSLVSVKSFDFVVVVSFIVFSSLMKVAGNRKTALPFPLLNTLWSGRCSIKIHHGGTMPLCLRMGIKIPHTVYFCGLTAPSMCLARAKLIQTFRFSKSNFREKFFTEIFPISFISQSYKHFAIYANKLKVFL